MRPEVMREALAQGWDLEEDWSTYDAQRGARGYRPHGMPSAAWDSRQEVHGGVVGAGDRVEWEGDDGVKSGVVHKLHGDGRMTVGGRVMHGDNVRKAGASGWGYEGAKSETNRQITAQYPMYRPGKDKSRADTLPVRPGQKARAVFLGSQALTPAQMIKNFQKMHGRNPSAAQLDKLTAKAHRAALATAAGRTAMHMAADSPEPTLEESKQTAALSVTHAPIGKGGTNWVTRSKPGNTGQLPAYIQNVRNAIMRGGKSESEATGIAIGRIKDWASGQGGVGPEVRAAAAKAIAEFEAMRGASHAKSGAKRAAKKAV